MPDLGAREKWVLWPAIAMAVFMGVAPWVFLRPMKPAVNRIVARMAEAEPTKVVGPPRRRPLTKGCQRPLSGTGTDKVPGTVSSR